MLRFDYQSASSFLPEGAIDRLRPKAEEAHRTLVEKTGAGNDFLGWRDLLRNPNDALLGDVVSTAEEIREKADVLLCIGIGGSYLGAKAVIQALKPYFPADGATRPAPEILFAGHHMSGAYLRELLAYLEGKSVYVNVISKSGTTLEPALAFRFVRQWLEKTYDDADKRIIVTTDPSKGALNQLHHERGYKKYVIPPDIGGRFSVLTPVGLLPIAVAGIDIRSLFYGAVAQCDALSGVDQNLAIDYALVRNALLEQGYSVELLSVFEPRLFDIGGWWQQLFGESEGKENKGLYPDAVQYSTDLHSLGQYVQQGKRMLLETFLMVENDQGDLSVPDAGGDLDGLAYLAGKSMSMINRKAYEGTAKAHSDGGVPVTTLWLDRITPSTIGECLYFFEHAVGVSGYMLGVNPFDQPGVEAYKKEMFRLLGRP
jgi:glucose-6-phosphate isomerase